MNLYSETKTQYLENNYCVGACISSSRLAKPILEKARFKVTVSPNPTTDNCLVDIFGEIKDNETVFFNVLNFSGSVIKSIELIPIILERGNEFEIKHILKTNDLLSGLYFIKINYCFNQKVIKLIIN